MQIQRGAWEIQRGAWEIHRVAWEIHRVAWEIQRGAWEIQRGAWEIQRVAWEIHRVAWEISSHAVLSGEKVDRKQTQREGEWSPTVIPLHINTSDEIFRAFLLHSS